jgi:hypothetical protein
MQGRIRILRHLYLLDLFSKYISYTTLKAQFNKCSKRVTAVYISWYNSNIQIYIQQDAKLHSLFISENCSTCFKWYLHPSSGVHITVSTACGICHAVTATCRYRGRVGTGLSVLRHHTQTSSNSSMLVACRPTVKYVLTGIHKWQENSLYGRNSRKPKNTAVFNTIDSTYEHAHYNKLIS